MASGNARNKPGGALRLAVNRAIEVCAHLAELHPYAWKLAWEAVHRLPFLLPHDKSYRALRHFIAIRPGGLFLDVGANDGISALSFRKFSKNYNILSLEPNPLLEPALRKIKAADPHFDYKMIGAGSAPERMTFSVPTYKNIVLHTFTSGNRDHVLEAIVKAFGSSVADTVEIREFDCEIVPLDELNINPTIIKIDAEGFDYAVLQGLNATIGRSRPFIVIEISSLEYDQVMSYFSGKHYVLLAYNLFTDSFRPGLASWSAAVNAMTGHRNFFAIPEEMMNSIPLE